MDSAVIHIQSQVSTDDEAGHAVVGVLLVLTSAVYLQKKLKKLMFLLSEMMDSINMHS